MDDIVEQQHYQNLHIIDEIKDDLHYHQVIDCQLLINVLMEDVLTINKEIELIYSRKKRIYTGIKCSRVVAILTVDARFFLEGKNGKPD